MIVHGCWLAMVLAAGGSWNVRTFGAAGDGAHLDSPAINQAIGAAARTGGTVVVPPGRYRCRSIHLLSHVELRLEAGAAIEAAAPGPDGGYDAPEPNPGGERWQDFGHSHWHNSLIWADGAEDIAITGTGTLVGTGLDDGSGAKGEAVLPAGVGNKAVALRDCRRVRLQGITIAHGGHFAVLATGVDEFTFEGLRVDTNRDGIDLDCCRHGVVRGCAINSPNDDGLCLKSSLALGRLLPCEAIAIQHCQLSGYLEGTLIDGTRVRQHLGRGGPFGRIKLGTESNGPFRDVTVSECAFDYSRGLAIESVDGAAISHLQVTGLTLREVPSAAIFIRLGSRLRGPPGTRIGSIRNVRLERIEASGVDSRAGILIAGLPGHPIEEVTLAHVRLISKGRGTIEQARRHVPEFAQDYPEPGNFGPVPAWGLWARHVRGLTLADVRASTEAPDARPAMVGDDLTEVSGTLQLP